MTNSKMLLTQFWLICPLNEIHFAPKPEIGSLSVSPTGSCDQKISLWRISRNQDSLACHQIQFLKLPMFLGCLVEPCLKFSTNLNNNWITKHQISWVHSLILLFLTFRWFNWSKWVQTLSKCSPKCLDHSYEVKIWHYDDCQGIAIPCTKADL